MDEIGPMAAGAPPWRHHMVGRARHEHEGGVLRLTLDAADGGAYCDAQIDDYRPGRRRAPHGATPAPLRRRPPLVLRLRARASHGEGALRGTAGFGFWNYPFAAPRPPRAIWFFHGSPPSDLPLALGVPGSGWKAAVVDAGRPQALALLPLAPLAVPLLRVPALATGLYAPIQRAAGVAEALVRAPLDRWHEYSIEWGERRSRLLVDGRVVLEEAPSPRGPLCFVAWLDNQYLVLTPQGRVRWGLLPVAEPQWLELAELSITPG